MRTPDKAVLPPARRLMHGDLLWGQEPPTRITLTVGVRQVGERQGELPILTQTPARPPGRYQSALPILTTIAARPRHGTPASKHRTRTRAMVGKHPVGIRMHGPLTHMPLARVAKRLLGKLTPEPRILPEAGGLPVLAPVVGGAHRLTTTRGEMGLVRLLEAVAGVRV